ncbi:hypothetical protein [Rossellomorea marisflavi]|uniref:hypothetical protein n=1 Tax=Rossellomorea marisflavi TaxID=189381 RepID=UPI00345CC2F0
MISSSGGGSTVRIYAIPVINGVDLGSSTDYVCNGDKATIDMYVRNEEDVKKLDSIIGVRSYNENCLSVKFTGSDKLHHIFDGCTIKISRVDSAMDDFTRVTIEVTEFVQDEPFIRRIQP